ncbi:hypothetical protein Lal_00015058 [Lupinus albus]|nr:hypothetical protein Lal_00015058 [Lupinus albus]
MAPAACWRPCPCARRSTGRRTRRRRARTAHERRQPAAPAAVRQSGAADRRLQLFAGPGNGDRRRPRARRRERARVARALPGRGAGALGRAAAVAPAASLRGARHGRRCRVERLLPGVARHGRTARGNRPDGLFAHAAAGRTGRGRRGPAGRRADLAGRVRVRRRRARHPARRRGAGHAVRVGREPGARVREVGAAGAGRRTAAAAVAAAGHRTRGRGRAHIAGCRPVELVARPFHAVDAARGAAWAAVPFLNEDDNDIESPARGHRRPGRFRQDRAVRNAVPAHARALRHGRRHERHLHARRHGDPAARGGAAARAADGRGDGRVPAHGDPRGCVDQPGSHRAAAGRVPAAGARARGIRRRQPRGHVQPGAVGPHAVRDRRGGRREDPAQGRARHHALGPPHHQQDGPRAARGCRPGRHGTRRGAPARRTAVRVHEPAHGRRGGRRRGDDSARARGPRGPGGPGAGAARRRPPGPCRRRLRGRPAAPADGAGPSAGAAGRRPLEPPAAPRRRAAARVPGADGARRGLRRRGPRAPGAGNVDRRDRAAAGDPRRVRARCAAARAAAGRRRRRRGMRVPARRGARPGAGRDGERRRFPRRQRAADGGRRAAGRTRAPAGRRRDRCGRLMPACGRRLNVRPDRPGGSAPPVPDTARARRRTPGRWQPFERDEQHGHVGRQRDAVEAALPVRAVAARAFRRDREPEPVGGVHRLREVADRTLRRAAVDGHAAPVAHDGAHRAAEQRVLGEPAELHVDGPLGQQADRKVPVRRVRVHDDDAVRTRQGFEIEGPAERVQHPQRGALAPALPRGGQAKRLEALRPRRYHPCLSNKDFQDGHHDFSQRPLRHVAHDAGDDPRGGRRTPRRRLPRPSAHARRTEGPDRPRGPGRARRRAQQGSAVHGTGPGRPGHHGRRAAGCDDRPPDPHQPPVRRDAEGLRSVLARADVDAFLFRPRLAEEVGAGVAFQQAPADRRRLLCEPEIRRAVARVGDEAGFRRHRAAVRHALGEAPVAVRVAEHEVVAVRVVRPRRPLFRDAVAVVVHDVVDHPRVVVRPRRVIEVAAAHDDARARCRHGVVGDDHVVRVVPQVDAGGRHAVHDVVADRGRRVHVDPLHPAATGRTDVVHAVAGHLGMRALVITVHADAGAAAVRARHRDGHVVHVVADDPVVRAAAVDARRPADAGARVRTVEPGAAVDVEAFDVDVAGAVVPAQRRRGHGRRNDVRAPALRGAEHDARVRPAVDRRAESAVVGAGQHVDDCARRDELGRAGEGAQRRRAGARIAVQPVRRDVQLRGDDFRRHRHGGCLLHRAGGEQGAERQAQPGVHGG